MKTIQLSIRQAEQNDLESIFRVFQASIIAISENNYSEKEKLVWLKSTEDKQRWLNKIASQYFIVAEQHRQLVGFASLEKNYIDLMYVHPHAQRQGIAQVLLNTLEEQAKRIKNTTLFSDVSKAARPFFEKNKFVVLHENKVHLGGEVLTNYSMKKKPR